MPPTDLLCLCQQYNLRDYFGAGFDDPEEFRLVLPDEVEDPAAIRFAIAYRPSNDAFDRFPNIELVCGVGAGADGLLQHPGVRPDIGVVRMINPDQARMMAGYAAHYVLAAHRDLRQYEAEQHAKRWAVKTSPDLPMNFPVAVLGYGEMGRAIGRVLDGMGYPVAGWASRARTVDGVRVLAGRDGLREVLSTARAVIGVLPLSDATRDFFDAKVFAMMRDDATLIQIGRGGHLVEDDLIAALAAGRPSHAVLDVTRTEPLPDDSPLWSSPKITITPHVASDSEGAAIARSIRQTIRTYLQGGRPAGLVDRAKGY